jgi:hypothetical protein
VIKGLPANKKGECFQRINEVDGKSPKKGEKQTRRRKAMQRNSVSLASLSYQQNTSSFLFTNYKRKLEVMNPLLVELK